MCPRFVPFRNLSWIESKLLCDLLSSFYRFRGVSISGGFLEKFKFIPGQFSLVVIKSLVGGESDEKLSEVLYGSS